MNAERQRPQDEAATELTRRAPVDLPPPEGEEERFLRPFAVDAGVLAPRPGGPVEQLEMLSRVVAARTPGRNEWLRPERETILTHAQRAGTVVELAAELGLPLGQVRAIAAEMLAEGSLQRCGPTRSLGHSDILHAVLVGLRSL
ncbi:DUF742 domain-containing protein [Nocardiopsis kunsanensis]|uniref:DUF742 domain-containing protein n=1 Tax=Nocardiopsis kunsanensis TaxID=141693 RepID=A0A918XJ16_9ACTN|nr:DUF742 domain-containing protein [Nocardiopsis kunsanensis]GHD33074.1 hypothetical protein GCM10007147_37330 [Nocardiopsis kunsanensis]